MDETDELRLWGGDTLLLLSLAYDAPRVLTGSCAEHAIAGEDAGEATVLRELLALSLLPTAVALARTSVSARLMKMQMYANGDANGHETKGHTT